jgi:Xaa-Pro aminopeptidase
MLTLDKCPLHKNLINVDLLEATERAWVNSYHQQVLQNLFPFLVNDAGALEWLKRQTSPL